MQENPPTAPGLIGSLQMLGAGLMAGVRDRVELLGLELQEEKFRLVQTLVWIGVVMFTGALAVMFASFTLVVLFWENSRVAVLGGLTVFYGTALAVMIVAFRRFLARQPRPLAGTLEELREDDACIRDGS